MPVYFVIALAALLAPGKAPADERVETTYEVLWGGLEIGRFEARLSADEAAYTLAYHARTTGFLGWLFPFVSEGASRGVLDGSAPVPARFAGRSQRRDDWSRWAVDFAPDGGAERVEVAGSIDEQRDPVPVALRRGPDPLALALEASGTVGAGAGLVGTTFDGKRAIRFELACDRAERPVELVAGSLELGRVLGCTLDGDLEAGRSRRWQSGRDEAREPARILMSRELVPGRYWPVRVEAATRFGTVIVRLVELRSSDDGRSAER